MTTATDALDQMLAELPLLRGPRMSFQQQCAAFYLLERRRFPRSLIAELFDLSAASIGALANCRNRPPAGQPWRYGKVAREFERLGAQEFSRVYYDLDVHDRLAKLRMNRPNPSARRDGFGPDPAARKYATQNFGAFPVPMINGKSCHCEVIWRADGEAAHPETDEPIKAGWTWRVIGENVEDWRRYRTSALAYDACFDNHAADSPRHER